MDDNERYDIIKKEIDTLQIQLAQVKKAWYTQPSVLISLTALLFSFGTTIVAYINSYNEAVMANHREAMTIIQRLTKLPSENFDLLQKYKDSGAGQSLSGMINQENILLATQAANLVNKHPESFTSTEFFAIATALSNSNITEIVPYLFNTAIEKSTSGNDYNVSTRAYAIYLYSKGEYKNGDLYFKKAMNVWEKFPEKINI